MEYEMENQILSYTMKRSWLGRSLVAGQLSFGLPYIGQVTLPQIDVQDFHQTSLKQLESGETEHVQDTYTMKREFDVNI